MGGQQRCGLQGLIEHPSRLGMDQAQAFASAWLSITAVIRGELSGLADPSPAFNITSRAASRMVGGPRSSAVGSGSWSAR